MRMYIIFRIPRIAGHWQQLRLTNQNDKITKQIVRYVKNLNLSGLLPPQEICTHDNNQLDRTGTRREFYRRLRILIWDGLARHNYTPGMEKHELTHGSDKTER